MWERGWCVRFLMERMERVCGFVPLWEMMLCLFFLTGSWIQADCEVSVFVC